MRRPPSQRWVRQLQATVPRTVRIVDMHQKIVVVDDSITMMGSCNVLSQAEAATREMMTVFEGTHFAKWVLRQEHAEKFGSPPSCPRCGTGSVEVERSRSKQRGYPWMWRCPQMGCKHRWEVEGLRSTPGLS